MRNRKIACIICVNDETYYKECLFYISRLCLPEGFELEVYPVRDAASIYQGYQQAMAQSDAEYKVYMHQDVFLIDRDILTDMISLFERHPRAGLAGVLGAGSVSKDRRFYRSWDLGNVVGCSEKKAFQNQLDCSERQAAVLDGMFLMTSKDLPWRQDALGGWDFYDISLSLEFQKAGYEIWIPQQPKPRCIHDCGYLNLTAYDEAWQAFLKVYRENLPDYGGQSPVYPQEYQERFQLMMEIQEQWKALLFLGEAQKVREMLKKLEDERFFDTETAVLKNILEILEQESKEGVAAPQGFLYDCGSFAQAYQKYLRVKFWLRRKKYAPDDAGSCPEASKAAQQVIRKHTMLEG